MFETAGVANALACLTIIGTLIVKLHEWPRWKRVALIAMAFGCGGFAVQFYRDNAEQVHSSLAALYSACVWLLVAAVLCACFWARDLYGQQRQPCGARRGP